MQNPVFFMTYTCDHKQRHITGKLTEAFENEELTVTTRYTSPHLHSTIIPHKKLMINEVYLLYDFDFNPDDKIFLNGFQSWSESKEFRVYDKIKPFPFYLMPILNRYKIKNYGDYTIVKYSGRKGKLHGYTYTYISHDSHNCTFIGSLHEKSGFTIFKYDTLKKQLKVTKDCRGLKIERPYHVFDLFIKNGNEHDIINEYFSLQDIKPLTTKPHTGWTSWYNYYTNISEKIVLENLDAFSRNDIPIDIFQIDDGYQKAVGDWISVKDTFPNGMRYISDEIKRRGYKAGIWIAPFICQKRSYLFENYNDWLLKDDNGDPIPLGYSKGYWDDYFYVLNFHNNDVRSYLKKVFNIIFNEWHFDMVKIDFIYALTIYKTDYQTRAMIYHEAISFLKELTKGKLVLGCGVPLASAFGKFDFCRVGSDIGPAWENNLYKFIQYRERVSTVNSLRSTVGRRHLNHRGFLNDPDVFILRKGNNQLTHNQKYTLFLINQIFGSLLFTSDNVGNYDDRMITLYKSQFPIRKKNIISVDNRKDVYTIRFTIDDLSYLVCSNFTQKRVVVSIPDGLYYDNIRDTFFTASQIPLDAFQSVCLLHIQHNDFELVGSTSHLFPGSEVAVFGVNNDTITVQLDEKLLNRKKLYIKIPPDYEGCSINDTYHDAQEIAGLKLLIF